MFDLNKRLISSLTKKLHLGNEGDRKRGTRREKQDVGKHIIWYHWPRLWRREQQRASLQR